MTLSLRDTVERDENEEQGDDVNEELFKNSLFFWYGSFNTL